MEKIIKSKNLYMVTFSLWFGMELLYSTTWKGVMGLPAGVINGAVNVVVLMLLMLQIVRLARTYSKRELFLIAGISVPIVIAAFLSGNKSLLAAWMFLAAAKNEDMDRALHMAYRMLLFGIPAVFLLCFFGFIEDNVLIMRQVQRYSLGFVHPNTLGMRIFQLILCHCYIHRERLGVIHYLSVVFAVLFVYKFPNSQTVCICLLFFLFLLLLSRFLSGRKRNLWGIYAKCLVAGAVLANVASLFLSFFDVSRNPVLAHLNVWMSSRFACANRVWALYGVSFLGQKIYVSEEERKLAGITEKLWLDNAYMSILLRHGIVTFLLFSIGYVWLMKYAAAQKKYMLLTVLFLFAVYGIMETGMYAIGQNLFLLFFADLIYRKGDGGCYEKNHL